MTLTAYTLQQCVEACTLFNLAAGNKTCTQVGHSAHMLEYYNKWAADCFLKKNQTSQGGKVDLHSCEVKCPTNLNIIV
jgi:hypothetical protein